MAQANPSPKQLNEQFEFKDKNFIEITGTFTEQMRNDFTRKVMTYEDKELLIYIDSPGGSVFAVSRMIGVMDSSDIKFTCIARFAASAAFMLFQNCDKRIMLPDGILMSHNAAGGFSGELPRVRSLLTVIEAVVDRMEIKIAKRLKMSLKEYKALINNNLWMDTTLATKYNALEGVSNNVKCSKDLIKKKTKTVLQSRSIFGMSSREVYKSACPLLSDELEGPRRERDEYEDADDFIYLKQALPTYTP